MKKDECINYKSDWETLTISENGVVKQIINSCILQPAVHFNGGSIKWFDDTRLLKKKGGVIE